MSLFAPYLDHEVVSSGTTVSLSGKDGETVNLDSEIVEDGKCHHGHLVTRVPRPLRMCMARKEAELWCLCLQRSLSERCQMNVEPRRITNQSR